MESKFRGVRKGAWTKEEDDLLRKCIEEHGNGKWHQVPLRAGLNRCRKSCRLRWLNYLRPDIKRGYFSNDEIDLIVRLHKLLRNRWSLIAGRLPGRTANDVKNFWNTHAEKKLSLEQGTKSINDNINQNPNIIINNVERPKTFIHNDHIIKPKPRTFSKIALNKNRAMEIERNKGESSNKMPILESSWQEKVDDCMEWWSDLLQETENNETVMVESSSGVGDDLKGSSCFSIDELDVWELLNDDIGQ